MDNPLVVVEVDPDADPSKELRSGPDRAGNLLKVIIVSLADGSLLVIHAMQLRRSYYDLLPSGEDVND